MTQSNLLKFNTVFAIFMMNLKSAFNCKNKYKTEQVVNAFLVVLFC